MHRPAIQFVFVTTVAAMICGCNGQSLPLVPVSGKVTFAGELPPHEGTVTFTPIKVADGHPQRPGSAHFDQQGEFKVTSFKTDDGLIPGTYYASVTCWSGKPSSSDPSSFERLNCVPKDFAFPPVVVPQSGKVDLAIDVPKKK